MVANILFIVLFYGFLLNLYSFLNRQVGEVYRMFLYINIIGVGIYLCFVRKKVNYKIFPFENESLKRS